MDRPLRPPPGFELNQRSALHSPFGFESNQSTYHGTARAGVAPQHSMHPVVRYPNFSARGPIRFNHRAVQPNPHPELFVVPRTRFWNPCAPMCMPMHAYPPTNHDVCSRLNFPQMNGYSVNRLHQPRPFFAWPEKDSNFFIQPQVGMKSVPCENDMRRRPTNILSQSEPIHFPQATEVLSKETDDRCLMDPIHRVIESPGYRFPITDAMLGWYNTEDTSISTGSSEKLSDQTGLSKALNTSSKGITPVSELDNFELPDELPENHVKTKTSRKKKKKKSKTGIDWSFFDRLKDPEKPHFNSASASSSYWYQKGTNGPFRGVQVVSRDSTDTELSSHEKDRPAAPFGDYLWHSVTTNQSKNLDKNEVCLERDKLNLVCYKEGQEAASFFSFLDYAKHVKHGSSINAYHNFLDHIDSSNLPGDLKKFFKQFCDEFFMPSSPTNDELGTIDSFGIGFIRLIVERAMELKDLSSAIREFQPKTSR
ncbi:hypothetical protein [Endozoicomonas atrinae]|uniref:hypothetical protein n=1 Tax=Endozoicomonas atrinae TaxID=1333660 RepID=UPI000AEC2110|nr:hypothetical protein [Endozoicomonas atrinae]